MSTASEYKVEGPAVISFSGGRTSGYMLRKVLDAHGGTLPADVFVVFADTHKERPETLEFVRACADRWKVPIHWVEYPGGLEAIIRARSYLPNPVTRFCTTEGKIIPMMRFMVDRGFAEWTNVVGIRADEPRRVAKMRGVSYSHTRRPIRPVGKNHKSERPAAGWPRGAYEVALPLASAGVTVEDVTRFWDDQPFDLQLKSYQGNCDLCFLKGRRKLVQIIAEDPELAEWWDRMEREQGSTFRNAQPISSLKIQADALRRQVSLPLFEDNHESIACGACTD